MLIAVTQDDDIRTQVVGQDAAKNGATYWRDGTDVGSLVALPKGGQIGATSKLHDYLKLAAASKSGILCLTGHGNDTEIGDATSAGWGWTAKEIGGMIAGAYGPSNQKPTVLFSVCCNSVANFSAHVAVAIGDQGMSGVWCWGYNRSVDADIGFPDPNMLSDQVALQPTKS